MEDINREFGIKDWITQANSGHRDRMTQPKNVSVMRGR
jgi:hypothetical protein